MRREPVAHSQISDWTTPVHPNIQMTTFPATVRSNVAPSTVAASTYSEENPSRHVGRNLPRAILAIIKCCPQTALCFRGILFGVLTAAIALAIILTLYLTTKQPTMTSSDLIATTKTSLITSTITSISTVTITIVTTTTGTSSTTASTTTITATTTTVTTTITTTTATTATTATTTTTTITTTVTTTTATSATTETTTLQSTTTASTNYPTSMLNDDATTSPTTTPTCGGTPNTAGALFSYDSGTAPTIYTLYTHTFIAPDSSSTLAFIITGDSGPAHHYWLLDSVSVIDTSNNTNILINGGFEAGSLTGWSQWCANDANCGGSGTNYGQLTATSCQAGTYCYVDKCNNHGNFDYLFQSFPTVAGRNYQIKFYFKVNANGGSHFAYVMLW